MTRRPKRGTAQGGREALEYFARCASGFEPVLADELRSLGMHRVRPLKGGVAFFGPLADGYRACLWCRCATRVQLVLARVAAADAETLYQGVDGIAWERHLRQGGTLAVDAHGQNAALRNTRFVALKVKDAICDHLRSVWGTRPDVDAHDPDVAINVAVHSERATIYLNLSGASLHRRGYRADGVQTAAPLKETLAAGILLLAGWPEIAERGGMLVDPMCGSGTFAIEAALMAQHAAPGILRRRWGFAGWARHDEGLWQQVLDEARRTQGAAKPGACIWAGDIDSSALAIARDNADRAGVASLVCFEHDDAAHLGRHLHGVAQAPGLMVANPPYGQRLGADEGLEAVRAALVQAAGALPADWKLALITPDAGIDTALGRQPDQTIACYNGPIEAWVRLYSLGDSARRCCEVVSLAGVQRRVPIADEHSIQFAARLRKVGKERARWARREGVSCYRVYDADLPDYAISVDVYEGAGEREGKRWAVVERQRQMGRGDALGKGRRMADALALVAAVLDVPAGQVVERGHAGASRQGSAEARVRPFQASEAGLAFSLDLADPYDVMLPLRLRGVRDEVRRRADGRRVAVLFATNGATLAHAVAGGARSVVAVDGFEDRLEAMREQLVSNGMPTSGCHTTRADVRAWLRREAKARHAYDLVACAPPAWLPACDKDEGDWDCARDASELVRQVAKVLSSDGTLLLALPKGMSGAPLMRELGEDARYRVRDLSAVTLPPDFVRTADQHCCLLVGKVQVGRD